MKKEDNIFKLLDESDNDIIKWFAMASVTILATRIDQAAKQKNTDTDIDIEAIKKQAYDDGFRDGQIKCNDTYYVGFQKGYSMGEDDAKKNFKKSIAKLIEGID